MRNTAQNYYFFSVTQTFFVEKCVFSVFILDAVAHPCFSANAPQISAEAPCDSGEALQISAEAPCDSGEALQISGEAPCDSGEAPCDFSSIAWCNSAGFRADV